MHFVKFHTVSQMQSNVELITELLARPQPKVKDQKNESDSPPLHSRTQSSFYSPQHTFSLAEHPTSPSGAHKNPESAIKRGRDGVRKEPMGMKVRKSSENNIIPEHE